MDHLSIIERTILQIIVTTADYFRIKKKCFPLYNKAFKQTEINKTQPIWK